MYTHTHTHTHTYIYIHTHIYSPWVYIYTHICIIICTKCIYQVVLVVKNLPASAGDIRDTGSIPVSARSPGEGNGNSLQQSCLGNPVDRGTWQAAVSPWGCKKSDTTEATEHTYVLLKGYYIYRNICQVSKSLDNFSKISYGKFPVGLELQPGLCLKFKPFFIALCFLFLWNYDSSDRIIKRNNILFHVFALLSNC